MRKPIIGVLIVLVAYLSTGLFIVVGNEQAVIRRFGKIVRTADGAVLLKPNGLHWDLPWPWSEIDRVRLDESHVVTLPRRANTTGFARRQADPWDEILGGADVTGSQYLTGDRNILQVEIAIQYRPSADRLDDYLDQHVNRDEHLVGIVESLLAETIASSGVDYVHPLGLSELQQTLLERADRQAQAQRLGIELESISIESVSPPTRVKADFLDVANARNDQEKYINAARAYAAQRTSEARAESQRVLNAAWAAREQSLQRARAVASSFDTMLNSFGAHPDTPSQSARHLALERLYLEALEDILGRVQGQVVLDSGESIDITVLRTQARMPPQPTRDTAQPQPSDARPEQEPK